MARFVPQPKPLVPDNVSQLVSWGRTWWRCVTCRRVTAYLPDDCVGCAQTARRLHPSTTRKETTP